MSRPEFARRVNALAQFRVDDPANPKLCEADSHHLFRVLRASVDEEVVVTDGRGGFAFARVADGRLERCSAVMADDPPSELELYLAPLKSERSEWAIAKVTEVGATRVVPLLSAHVVARWRGEAGHKALARWRRVAAEAAGQCRRTFDLVVADPVAVDDVARDVAVCDVGGDSTLDGVTALAVGPEGGWAPNEWTIERRRVGLGATVLRSETAAVAAAVMLASRGPGWAAHADAPER